MQLTDGCSVSLWGPLEGSLGSWTDCQYLNRQSAVFVTQGSALRKAVQSGGLEHEFYDFPFIGNSNPN